MKKALKRVKFGLFLSIIFVLGLALSGGADISTAFAKQLPPDYTYNYYHPYQYPYFISLFTKDKNTDDQKIIVPTRSEVSETLSQLLK